MANVELKNLTKKYGDVIAVQNMDLFIPHNEFLVLVGPSGCGKSTTLRMIAGLEEITGGEIFIDDQLVNEKDPKDKLIIDRLLSDNSLPRQPDIHFQVSVPNEFTRVGKYNIGVTAGMENTAPKAEWIEVIL